MTKKGKPSNFSRRGFIQASSFLMSGLFFNFSVPFRARAVRFQNGTALRLLHFPSTLHAFIWRNWTLVPLERLAAVVKANPEAIRKLGEQMGLRSPHPITENQLKRSYLTIIRCNWHILPRTQLLELLGWTEEQLTFTLQEDDFFYIKLGSHKPICKPLYYTSQAEKELQRMAVQLNTTVVREFPEGLPAQEQPLFSFVKELSETSKNTQPLDRGHNQFSPRFGYAYYALFGDPLLNPEINSYPDGYLQKMADSGMDSTWMHIVLSTLAPFPWAPEISENYERRLANLARLVERANKFGIGIYLYLNEPRNMPLSFFEKHPDLKGITNGGHASLCTSHPEVQRYIVDSIALITRTVPGIAGFFSISASENPTNCWSHYRGGECSRCSKRKPAEVIAELNNLYHQGIDKGISDYQIDTKNQIAKKPHLITWDWGWLNDWAEDLIPKLNKEIRFMSVSEWDMEIERGGIRSGIGEYSLSVVGPGPRATRHWKIAKENGLKTIAKIQANNSWEIAAVPYIPVLENVATHAANLRELNVDGVMLGWSLGGFPSPNLEVVSVIGRDRLLSPLKAMQLVANRRYGTAGPAVVNAWKKFSAAFREFPFGSGLYFAPFQMGPANLLWKDKTGYAATMVGIPYDDVAKWAGNYPMDIFIHQLLKIADGFDKALTELNKELNSIKVSKKHKPALQRELRVAETVAIHYRSVANQATFVTLRDKLNTDGEATARQQTIVAIEEVLNSEIQLAKRMLILQGKDSTLGYEASNHYFYIPADLVEKVINCQYLLNGWLVSIKMR